MALADMRLGPVVRRILVTVCNCARNQDPGRRAGARAGRRGVAAAYPVAVAVLALAALAACTDDTPDGGRAPAGTPTVSAPQQDARGTAQEQALAAYRDMWQAYAKAGATANADEPDLARYASDRALKALKDGLADLKREGKVLKGEYGSKPQVATSPAPSLSTITVEDCLDSRRFQTYKAATGELADDDKGGHRAASATVTRLGADGTWKVTDFAVRAVGTC